MLNIRIVATGTLVAAALSLAVVGAAAQSTQSAGKPLPLLQFFQQKSKAKPAPHQRLAAKAKRKTAAERRIAKRMIAAQHEAVAQAPQTPTATAAAPENIWPAAASATPGAIATLAPPQTPAQMPASVSTEKVVETDPNEIVSGGHIVQLSSPDQVNAIDLAADDHQKAPPPAASAAPAESSAAKSAPAESAVAASTAAASTAAVHALVARAAVQSPNPPSPVGSASWIAQVLAALGGAIAAGALAWFLIKPTPERTYG